MGFGGGYDTCITIIRSRSEGTSTTTVIISLIVSASHWSLSLTTSAFDSSFSLAFVIDNLCLSLVVFVINAEVVKDVSVPVLHRGFSSL